MRIGNVKCSDIWKWGTHDVSHDVSHMCKKKKRDNFELTFLENFDWVWRRLVTGSVIKIKIARHSAVRREDWHEGRMWARLVSEIRKNFKGRLVAAKLLLNRLTAGRVTFAWKRVQGTSPGKLSARILRSSILLQIYSPRGLYVHVSQVARMGGMHNERSVWFRW